MWRIVYAIRDDKWLWVEINVLFTRSPQYYVKSDKYFFLTHKPNLLVEFNVTWSLSRLWSFQTEWIFLSRASSKNKQQQSRHHSSHFPHISQFSGSHRALPHIEWRPPAMRLYMLRCDDKCFQVIHRIECALYGLLYISRFLYVCVFLVFVFFCCKYIIYIVSDCK